MTKLKTAQLVCNSADEQDRLLRRQHPSTPLSGDGSLSKTELDWSFQHPASKRKGLRPLTFLPHWLIFHLNRRTLPSAVIPVSMKGRDSTSTGLCFWVLICKQPELL